MHDEAGHSTKEEQSQAWCFWKDGRVMDKNVHDTLTKLSYPHMSW